MKDNKEILHFKFDVSTFRLLGRELITDRITALFELVKNCYDANADNVTITFENVNPLSSNSRIIIEDDGLGMTDKDIRNKWMVIGTSSKRRGKTSPAPYNRVVAGKKGVGRFAVDKLGAKLILKTKKKSTNQWQCLETDWGLYSAEEDRQLTIDFDNLNQQPRWFTEMDNVSWTEDGNFDTQGTRLEISSLNDVWTDNDIRRAYKELSKIVRPAKTIKYPFNIIINAPQYDEFVNRKVESSSLAKATMSFVLTYRKDEATGIYYQQYLEEQKGQLLVKEKPALNFGPISFSLYYYDKEGKKNFNKENEDRIDGIKIYRDGIIATPFAEYKSSRDEQKDLFGIDKRRWSGFFEKLSTRDILGWVDITEELNPKIQDSTNRQDFVDNQEWADLQQFVIGQIHQIELALKHKKETAKVENQKKLKKSESEFDDLQKRINAVKASAQFLDPKVEAALEDIAVKIQGVREVISTASNEYDRLNAEHEQQRNLMFSLVSLQTYASMLSHIALTSIGTIKRSAEFVSKLGDDYSKKAMCIKHAARVFNEMNTLSKAMEFMLSYAHDDSEFEEFNIKQITTELFEENYAELFEQSHIKTELVCPGDLVINYNIKAFQDMMGNLISNSQKAMRNNSGEKLIKCTISRENNQLIVLFSDNGEGISAEHADRIFDVFYTTTADLGGAGLGLYIIRKRLESIQGTIETITPEFIPRGATFKITIPLIN